MKKIYHLCLSSSDEVMFREDKDYQRAYNCFALAAAKTGSQVLADSIMSNHVHFAVVSTAPEELMEAYRFAYSRYFNSKYLREGRMGERYAFITEIEGIHRILATISYILRNALHHGVCATPFGYPHNSSNVYFQKELGKVRAEDVLPEKSMYRFLPGRCRVPAHFKMSSSGVFMRECVTEVAQVELLYGTAKNFSFHMNRTSGEQWESEQKEDTDTNTPIITLKNIEHGFTSRDIDRMLIHEKGKSDYKKMSDIALCWDIDNIYVKRYHKKSVYRLAESEKRELGNMLFKMHIPVQQIKRCLILK